MTESYAAQDNDYLATHRTQTTTPSGNSPATPSFLPTSSSGGSQSTADNESTAQRPGAPAASSTSTAAPSPASAESSSSGPTTAPAGMTITGCTGSTEATALSLPATGGSAQGRTSFCHRKNSSSSGEISLPCLAESVAHSPLGGSSSAGRGIKRRGSDSCIVLMAVSHGQARKRRSLEAPASHRTPKQQPLKHIHQQPPHSARSAHAAAAETAAPSLGTAAFRASAAQGAWPSDGHTANMRKSHGLPGPRDPARRNGSRGRAASLSPTRRTRAAPRRLPVAGTASAVPAASARSAALGSAASFGSGSAASFGSGSAASFGSGSAASFGSGSAASFGSGSPRMLRRRVADSDSTVQAAAPCSTPACPPAAAAAGAQASASASVGTRQPQQLGSASQAASRQQVSALPPVNRYTLRELKINNILQNPRLRHEVLFEPKLEFRPNSSGQLAEAKQRAAQQYWAGVDHEVRAVMAAPTASGVATMTMLIVELREILAEMCDDAPKSELARHAVELRERIDEECVRQQLLHGVFNPAPMLSYMASVMRAHAQPARHAAIARLTVYVQRGRLARALRGAFDVLEAIKIDTANSSIDMYREYMRATAAAFERSHFNLAVRRNTIALDDTTAWWQRALDDARAQGRHTQGLDAVFYAAGRELVLDDSTVVPALFRMDEARIQAVRREAERLAVVGMVFLAFSQFLQLVSRSAPRALAAEFTGANGRLDNERLASKCLELVPEGCGVQWAESLIGVRASSSAKGATARGDVAFSQLVDDLVSLAERVIARVLQPAEVAMLERTLLRAARHECPLREVVEDRVASALAEHTRALASLNGKSRGSECEAMPAAAKDMLRRSMLLFLAPPLAALSMKIHTVLSHHWQVYKVFYTTVSSAAHRDSARANSGKGKDGDSSAGAASGEAARSAAASASSSANTISAR